MAGLPSGYVSGSNFLRAAAQAAGHGMVRDHHSSSEGLYWFPVGCILCT